MTWIARNAFLALVVFATLGIIVMMAMAIEAKSARSDATTEPSGTHVSVL